ncbi:MAG TPA: DUF4254 domain-containing protein [Candidatus Limnocylindrales bacterium]|nr:DUF4254 domain-containing protein [Candidatus Limnocylindrales bacterium]
MTFFGIEIVALHDEALSQWESPDHELAIGADPPPPPSSDASGDARAGLRQLILLQHQANLSIWRLEDQARRRDVGDEVIAGIKRAIDPWNQRRNDLMERIDLAVLAALGAGEGRAAAGEQHSETAGMMIDRLSILALKIRNMAALAAATSDPALREECEGKAAILKEQRRDLAGCLQRLIEDCRSGRRHFKMYRQLKSYNDPRLNPALRATVRGDEGPRS